MAQALKIKFEKSPDLPGSDILPLLKDKCTGTRGKGTAWTEDEMSSLIEAIRINGRDWQSVALLVPTRNRA